MPHEARDNGNGEIVVIEQFKGTISFFAELNTVDSHGSLAPSVGMRHLFLTRTNALQAVKCLLNSTKPGTAERRPLAILPMIDRCKQALVKLALEPEWEVKFEPHSYGYRPGRGAHDAIAAILTTIERQPCFVFDADIEGAFDNLDQTVVLNKLQTFPALRQAINGWLRAGVVDGNTYFSGEKGIAQGGVLSPLLMNVALHGMEAVVGEGEILRFAQNDKRGQNDRGGRNNGGGRSDRIGPGQNDRNRYTLEQPVLVRYADDFVILHTDLKELQRAVKRVRQWLATMGLHLHAQKTR